MYELKKIGR